MQACAVSEISPAATSLRSWTAAGLTVLHEAFLRYRASLYGTDFFELVIYHAFMIFLAELAFKSDRLLVDYAKARCEKEKPFRLCRQ